jgi:hypothetical protein
MSGVASIPKEPKALARQGRETDLSPPQGAQKRPSLGGVEVTLVFGCKHRCPASTETVSATGCAAKAAETLAAAQTA